MNGLGKHILVDLYGCDRTILDDAQAVENIMTRAAIEAGSTIICSDFHQLSPRGVSGVVIIAESHLAIHTWPEHGYAALDVFTCGEDMNPLLAFYIVRQAVGAADEVCQVVQRGIPAS